MCVSWITLLYWVCIPLAVPTGTGVWWCMRNPPKARSPYTASSWRQPRWVTSVMKTSSYSSASAPTCAPTTPVLSWSESHSYRNQHNFFLFHNVDFHGYGPKYDITTFSFIVLWKYLVLKMFMNQLQQIMTRHFQVVYLPSCYSNWCRDSEVVH